MSAVVIVTVVICDIRPRGNGCGVLLLARARKRVISFAESGRDAVRDAKTPKQLSGYITTSTPD